MELLIVGKTEKSKDLIEKYKEIKNLLILDFIRNTTKLEHKQIKEFSEDAIDKDLANLKKINPTMAQNLKQIFMAMIGPGSNEKH